MGASHRSEEPLVEGGEMKATFNPTAKTGTESLQNTVTVHQESSGASRTGLVLSETTEFCSIVSTKGDKEKKRDEEKFTGSRVFQEEQVAKVHARGHDFLDLDLVVANSVKSLSNESSKPKSATLSNFNTSAKTSSASGNHLELDETLHERPLDNTIGSVLARLRDQNMIGKDHVVSDVLAKREGGIMDDTIGGSGEGSLAGQSQYVDEFGNANTKKTMFRQISWAFHGQTQCAGNATKRRQKMEREARMKTMDLSAPPTLQALQKTQEKKKLPYMSLG